MNVIVVRHAERVDKSNTSPITEAGKSDAVATGAWLHAQGVRPVLVLTTAALRTQQTAAGVLSAFPGVPVRVRSQGMAKNLDGWEKLVADIGKLLAKMPSDGDVLLVCHDPTQALVEKQFGGASFAVPKDNRCAAFILQVTEWHTQSPRCVAVWHGHPQRKAVL